MEQSFPVENSTRKSKVRSEHDNKSGEPSDKIYDQKSWEKFCKNSSNMTDEERQQEFVKHVVGNPFAKKVIGKGGPDKNATYIGILATLFGYLGVHDLNCGNIKAGIIKLVCTLSCVLSPVAMILNIMDLYKLGNGTYTAKNGIEIGKAPWCKIVAVVETILLVASFVGIFYVVAQLTEATAIFFASQR